LWLVEIEKILKAKSLNLKITFRGESVKFL